ncbi:MAG: LytTR family transcriptional regulator [Parabacteroides sp.]|nr:LytTR family transcriptional regulator [Parabacteroides sp.]
MKVKVKKSPIVISTVNELVRVCPERIVYISSDGNYSTMVLHDKTEQVFSFNLSHFQQIIEKQMKEEAALFIRIGKSLIINREYIYKINISRQLLVLADMKIEHTFALSASKEALRQLKQLLENEIEA